MKRFQAFLSVMILALALVCAASPVALCAEYQTLTLGDKGAEVLALKTRMHELGYFDTAKFSEDYNGSMVTRVKKLELQNGLAPTGVATPELQALIFSDAVRSLRQAPIISEFNEEMFVHPGEIELPQNLTQDGFLADMKNGAFVYASREEGHWVYISDTVRIEIKRWTYSEIPLVWFESDIYLTGDERLNVLMDMNAKKVAVKDPREIAKAYGAVFAVSDDFYGYRKKTGVKNAGIIVRGSKILSDKTAASGGTGLPNLDVIALFDDGSMETFESNELSGQDYLNIGATDTWAFGPYLLRGGEINPVLLSGKEYASKDPRNAMGMIEPNHYLFLSAEGRLTESVGTTPLWMAQRMLDLGCTEALNLDGGNSVALIFMDDLLNKTETVDDKNVRELSSLIGVGTK